MNPRTGYLLLGGLVIALGIVVVMSLPKDGASSGATADAASPLGTGSATADVTRDASGPRTLDHPLEAAFEMAVLTDRTEADLLPIVDAKHVASLLGASHCGTSCERVRAFVLDKQRFDTEIIKTDDWQLPPEDSFPTIAKGLTAEQRASLRKLPNVVVVRAHAPADRAQWAARAGFAATAALAEHLRGFVYDEVSRRIEDAPAFATHAIREPESESAYRPDRVVIQQYRQDDGSLRLLSLGMARFGTVDVEIRGGALVDSSRLGLLLNGVLSKLAGGQATAPFSLAIDEVAHANQTSVKELGVARGSTTEIDLVETERVEGDPENEMLRVVAGGSESCEGAVRALFGPASDIVAAAEHAPELVAIRLRAGKAWPHVVQARQAGASVMLKGRFLAPDAGAESMWIDVSTCAGDACTGTLTNSPVLVTDLEAGARVKVERANVVDYLIRWPDGGTEGGESISALSRR